MKREVHRVTFQPEGRNVFVLRGTKIVEAAGQAGIILNTPCGGEGTCGKCRVEVLGSAPEPTGAERRHLSEEQLSGGLRLACQAVVDRDMVVSVPEETRFFEQVILTEGKVHAYHHAPNVRKRHFELPEPTVEDLRSDVDRLTEALAEEGQEPPKVDLWLARQLPELLRSEGFTGTAVLQGNQVQCLERGDTTGSIWGVAFDVGTTTIVGTLVDLASGRQRAVASRTNPQVHFGDDVVSRIRFAEASPGGLAELHKRLVACLNDILLELTNNAGVELEDVYEATVVGNTTMMHTLLGISPAPIGHAPYVAVFREGMDVKARSVGLEINPNANLHALPNLAGFVGSDTVGMVMASGLAHSDELKLAIDIGTNGELVIGSRGRLLACSCAAGPAFEGARIRFGMRATEGAISKVVVNEEIEVGVIGGGRARGICGSGLLDAVAEMLRVGLIDRTGRIVEKPPDNVPKAVRRAVGSFDGQPAITLVDAHASRTGEPIIITQRDVRELQLAKAAIRAGIQLVCRQLEVAPDDLSQILLAGGFGNFLRRSNAKRVGLLPDIPTPRIEFIGNAASVGAIMALTCRECRQEASRISRKMEYVELANCVDFQMFFSEAMFFPENSRQ